MRMIYHLDSEGCWAESPDLPGFSAAAPSLEELRARVQSAVMEIAMQSFDVKLAREALCVAQTDVGNSLVRSYEERRRVIARLQQIIDFLDLARPLGSDGKHKELHTPFCGCRDMPRTPPKEPGAASPKPDGSR